MDQIAKPCLQVTGLHIEGLKALRRVEWPADGMSWNGRVPDLVMVGGVNGTGKTTLLDFIAGAASTIGRQYGFLRETWPPAAVNARLDLQIESRVLGSIGYRIIVGDDAYTAAHAEPESVVFRRDERGGYGRFVEGELSARLMHLLEDRERFAASDFPNIVYLPTDRRFKVPDERYKALGNLSMPEGYYHRFKPAGSWKDSLEALLYGARWADLNAKEEGHPEQATHFESYHQAFQVFFGHAKALVWERGELFVRIADGGALHPLMELSSGEKQALIFAAELYRLWRPGSLILIDEPELHFHPSWQTTLWLMLEKWQRERGGQVIVTTQSTHLFSIANPGTTVLLGGGLA